MKIVRTRFFILGFLGVSWSLPIIFVNLIAFGFSGLPRSQLLTFYPLALALFKRFTISAADPGSFVSFIIPIDLLGISLILLVLSFIKGTKK